METCVIDWCDKPRGRRRGMCDGHYQRYLKGQDMDKPFKVNTRSPEESLALRTVHEGDCIIWTGAKSDRGYGKIYLNGTTKNYVHRYVWERDNGPIPAGMEIDHTCWNRACVNPDHLRLTTRKQNTENLSGPRKSNLSGHRGVSRCRNGKWYVRVHHNGKCHYGGVHETLEEAAEAAREMRARLFTHSQN